MWRPKEAPSDVCLPEHSTLWPLIFDEPPGMALRLKPKDEDAHECRAEGPSLEVIAAPSDETRKVGFVT